MTFQLPKIQTVFQFVMTLAVGVMGGAIFFLIGLPAAWLSGSGAAVATVVLSGVRLQVPSAVRHTAFILLGAIMGSAVTPDTLALLSRWPATLAGLAVCVMGIMWACSAYLERVHGFDRSTARLSAVPGALPYVLALAADGRGDPARVAVIQVFRLTTLLLVLPSILTLFGEAPKAATLSPVHPVVALEVILLLAGSAVGAYVFALLKVPAPSLFGSMIAASVLYGTGLLTSGIPEWLAVTAFVVIGATIGSNFVGVDRAVLVDSLLAGLGSLVVGVLVAMVCAVTVGSIVGLSIEQLWLAYAPGGIDVMTVLALALGYDTAFIGGHHVARFLGLGVFVPFWLGKRSAPSSET